MTSMPPATHSAAATTGSERAPKLSAEQQIQNLLYYYAECMDEARFEDAASLFGRAAFWMGSHEVSAAQMLEQWRGLVLVHPDGTLRTAHITSNPLIEFSPDGLSATCRSRFTVVQATDTLPLQVICSGRYADTFAVTEGGEWYFTSRRYALPLVGDTSQHMQSF